MLNHLILLVRGGQTAAIDMYYGNPNLPDFGADAVLRAYEDVGLRVAFGMITRDQNRYVHRADESSLACLPPQLAAEVRESPVGYAWPVEEVFASYRSMAAKWDGRDDRIRVILAPDWTPACSDDLYRANRALANEFATGLTTHALETRSEMSFSFEHYGKSAMRRLHELGVLGPDACVRTSSGRQTKTSTARRDRHSCIKRPRFESPAQRGHRAGTRHPRSRRPRWVWNGREQFFRPRGLLRRARLAGLLQRRPMELASGRIPSEALLRSAATSGARGVRFESALGSLTPVRTQISWCSVAIACSGRRSAMPPPTRST